MNKLSDLQHNLYGNRVYVVDPSNSLGGEMDGDMIQGLRIRDSGRYLKNVHNI